MLQTQINYWANKEQKRHNLEVERLTRSQRAIEQQQANIAQQRADTDSINALTAQTNAEIQRAKVDQDYHIGLLNLDVASQNAQSARIQANAEANYKHEAAEKTRVETEFVPYQAGSSIVSNVAGAAKGLAKPVKDAAKGVKSLFSSVMYNLRN